MSGNEIVPTETEIFMAKQIVKATDQVTRYALVTSQRPDLMPGIDKWLIDNEYKYLVVEL